MTNTSATGGYLDAISTTPVQNDGFEDLIGGAISGIAGIPRVMVRPRWQPTPPAQPPLETNWCAVGITQIDADWSATVTHLPAGDGSDEVVRHDAVRVLASFYGPAGYGNATRVRDGLWVAQNRDALRSAGIVVNEADRIRTASDLVNERFIRRVDLDIVLRRAVVRVYPVLNLLSVQGSFRTDLGFVQNFTVTET